jgi:hypothetical protein
VGLVHGSRQRALDREDAEGHLAFGRGLDDGREARERDEVGAVREEAIAGGCGVRAVAPWIGDIHSHQRKLAEFGRQAEEHVLARDLHLFALPEPELSESSDDTVDEEVRG